MAPPASTASVQAEVDELYKLPIDQFTAARNALAKKTGGSVGADIRALAKPSLAAWAVNQVYWHARAEFDRLVGTARAAREAQRAVLSGRDSNLRAAEAAHRDAAREALGRATERLAAGGHKVTAATREALRRTLEALTGDEPRGRLTEDLAPAGFEALAGLTLERPDGPSAEGRRRDTGLTPRATPVPATEVPRAQRARTPRAERGNHLGQQRQAERERAIFEATKRLREAEREADRAGAASEAASRKVETLHKAEVEARESWETIRQRLAQAEEEQAAERRAREDAAARLDLARRQLDALRASSRAARR